MKKFLLTAALVLALVTSLTAGTMAYYNTSVSMGTSSIATKTFVFKTDTTSANFASGMNIAPGDTVRYKLALSNAGEVNTKATVVASLNKMFPGMSIDLQLLDDESDTGSASVVETNDGKTQTSTATMADTATDYYMVTVAWAYDDPDSNNGEYTNGETGLYAGQKGDNAIVLSININGQQLADSSVADNHSATAGVGVDYTDTTEGTFE